MKSVEEMKFESISLTYKLKWKQFFVEFFPLGTYLCIFEPSFRKKRFGTSRFFFEFRRPRKKKITRQTKT